ncbi:MAG: ATP-binding cassette domain-containing protein [Burkholderiaceae bacterium]
MSSPSLIPPFIRFTRVSHAYDARPALIDASFAVARGEFALLAGPSGAGKTTVLRLLAGLLQPDTGSIEVGGEPVDRLHDRRLAWLRRSMGVMLQDPMLLPDRSVLDNVMLPALAAELSVAEARERALAALSRCGIEVRANARPAELSGGEQQRAALARAVVNRPALILADEPTAHLDTVAASELMNLLAQFSLAGVTVLLASHHVALPATVRPRKISIAGGRISV